MRKSPFGFRLSNVFSVVGYGLCFFWALPLVSAGAQVVGQALSLSQAWRIAITALGWFGVAIAAGAAIRYLSDRPGLALPLLVFVILPGCGLALNAGDPDCRLNTPAVARQPFACPEVYGLLVLHLVTGAGYAISLRRPEPLPPRIEAWIAALLLCGFLLNIVLAIQLVDMVVWLLVFPVSLPIAAPFLAIILFCRELSRRLRAAAERTQSSPRLGPALLRSPIIIGAHALIQALWLGHPSGAIDVFTRTCTHPFSTLPLVINPSPGGHYLCTIAAFGHPTLVRPERLGVRRGSIIIVNRQLAIANAFEDLLHARWPRFGKFARRCYDHFAMPICGWIRRRWLADLLYLAMKPAEWLFYLALLMLDPECPEMRIDRMYR